MWALVMLISFLIPLNNRKKMFFLGSLFIFVSAIVYFMFMVAWLNLIIFLNYIIWVRILIGIVAIIGGLYYLKEFFKNNEDRCKIGSSELKQKVSYKISHILNSKGLFLAAVGIGILAFLINLMELICSAGLPVVYTQILSLSNLSFVQYYSYILFYIFIFMLDDLIVFFVAMISFNILRSTKYSRFSHLLGGVVLLILGVLLIFKPTLLMF
jgi:hypothetical protein